MKRLKKPTEPAEEKPARAPADDLGVAVILIAPDGDTLRSAAVCLSTGLVELSPESHARGQLAALIASIRERVGTGFRLATCDKEIHEVLSLQKAIDGGLVKDGQS